MDAGINEPPHGCDHGVRVVHDDVIADSENHESERDKLHVTSVVALEVVTRRVELATIAFNDEAVAHDEVEAVEVRKRNTHLWSRNYSVESQKNANDRLGAGLGAIIEEAQRCLELDRKRESGLFELETGHRGAVQDRIKDGHRIRDRLGAKDLWHEVRERGNSEPRGARRTADHVGS